MMMKYQLSLLLILFLSASLSAQDEENTKNDNGTETQPTSVVLNLPSLDKVWSIDDLTAFSNYLDSLSPEMYPALDGEDTGLIFQKFISSLDQDIIKDESVLIDTRMQLALRLGEVHKEVFYKYFAAVNQGLPYTTELCHLMGTFLVTSLQLMPVAVESMETLDPNEENYQIRVAGFKKMEEGMTLQITALLITLTETEIYNEQDRLILSGYLLTSSPTLITFFEPTVKEEIKSEIRKKLDIETSETIAENLRDLLLAIE